MTGFQYQSTANSIKDSILFRKDGEIVTLSDSLKAVDEFDTRELKHIDEIMLASDPESGDFKKISSLESLHHWAGEITLQQGSKKGQSYIGEIQAVLSEASSQQTDDLFKIELTKKEASNDFQGIFRLLTQPILITDDLLYPLEYNEQAEKIMSDLSPNSISSSAPISLDNILDLTSPDNRRFERLSDRLNDSDTTNSVTSSIITKSHQDPNISMEVVFKEIVYKNEKSFLIELVDINDQIRVETALCYKEQLLDSVLDNSKDAVIAFDANGDVELFSPSAEMLFGYSALEMLIDNISVLFDKGHWKKIHSGIEAIQASNDPDRKIVIENAQGINADGLAFPLSISISKIFLDSRYLYILTASNTVSFKTFIESVNDAFISLDETGSIVNWNTISEQLFGWTSEEMNHKYLSDLRIKRDDSSENYITITDLSDNKIRAELQAMPALYAKRGNGAEIMVTITTWPQENTAGYHYNTLIKDITQKKQSEEKLKYYAYFDSLTRLSNRANFLKTLTLRIEKYTETGETFALLFLDLDKFKWVNDTLGHDSGDQLLIETAARIKESISPVDIVSRLGGDEFTVLIDNPVNQQQIEDTSKKINDALREPFIVFGKTIHVSISIGITYFPENGTDVSSIMRAADIAMYHAKESGRDGFQFYTEQIHAQTNRRIFIENNLKLAIEKDEFELVFQPKVNSETMAILGFEALLRWEHDGQRISPAEFIPVAEESGLIIEINRWVFDAAIDQFSEWMKNEEFAKRRITLAINISVHHFKYELKKDLLNVIEKYKVDPELIEIEITESALMENIAECSEVLESISNKGITISIDDFGTGYSSLRYLIELSIDILKIDRAFIQDLVTNHKNRNLVGAIIAMARSIDMEVIIEGVESYEQLTIVAELGCTFIQGYYFSKPLLTCDVMGFLGIK